MYEISSVVSLLAMLGGLFLLNNLVNTFQAKFHSEELEKQIEIALGYGFKAMNEELRTQGQVEQMYAHAAGYMNINSRKTLNYFGINLEKDEGKHTLLTMLTAHDPYRPMFDEPDKKENVS